MRIMPPVPSGRRAGNGWHRTRAAGFAAGLPALPCVALRELPARCDAPKLMRPNERAAPVFSGQSAAISGLSRRRGLELYGQPFEHRLAPIVDAGRARFRAIGERLKQIGQLVVAMLFHEPRHIVRRPHGSQTIDSVGLRRSDRTTAPSRGIGHALTKPGFLAFSQLRLIPLR